jgi:hypothetical protein
MMAFLAASVTPDAMMFALWSLVLWLGVRAIEHGLGWSEALLLFGLTGAACCVKSSSYALIPGAVFVLAVGLALARGTGLRRIAGVTGGALLGLVVTIGVWKLVAQSSDSATSTQLSAAGSTAGASPRMFLSYLWQFYLPPLPFHSFRPFQGAPLPLDEIWLRRAWGAFAWLEVRNPPLIYPRSRTSRLSPPVSVPHTPPRHLVGGPPEPSQDDLAGGSCTAVCHVRESMKGGSSWSPRAVADSELSSAPGDAGPTHDGDWLSPRVASTRRRRCSAHRTESATPKLDSSYGARWRNQSGARAPGAASARRVARAGMPPVARAIDVTPLAPISAPSPGGVAAARRSPSASQNPRGSTTGLLVNPEVATRASSPGVDDRAAHFDITLVFRRSPRSSIDGGAALRAARFTPGLSGRGRRWRWCSSRSRRVSCARCRPARSSR